MLWCHKQRRLFLLLGFCYFRVWWAKIGVLNYWIKIYRFSSVFYTNYLVVRQGVYLLLHPAVISYYSVFIRYRIPQLIKRRILVSNLLSSRGLCATGAMWSAYMHPTKDSWLGWVNWQDESLWSFTYSSWWVECVGFLWRIVDRRLVLILFSKYLLNNIQVQIFFRVMDIWN